MSPRRVIIDTDPGQDDALAILLALASPNELDVVGITSVGGNVPLDLTTKNALILVELADRLDVPVHAGHAHPMDRPLVTAENVHGSTGLNGANRPDPVTAPANGHAVDFIIEQLDSNDRTTLCTLGPLTNIGDVFTQRPDLTTKVDQLVLMGGGHFEGGNVTPAAEFNIWVDPPAAATVFASGVDLVMMPLDVTHKALTSPERIQAFRDLGTPAGDACAGMLDFFQQYDIQRYTATGGPLHDPTVIAYLLEPEIFDGRRCNVEIELVSKLTMGATVVDWWQATERQANCLVINHLDNERFYELLTERIARL